MAYFLRQEKKRKGTYLQMYESYWDKEKKSPRSRYIKAFGYVDDLVSDEVPDPVAFYRDYVKKENEKRAASEAEETRPRAFAAQPEKNIGHFLVHSLLTELGVKDTIDILSSQRRFQFSIYDLICQLIYARVLDPCSKSRTAANVFPRLYNGVPISEDQIYDGCDTSNSSTTAMRSTTAGTLDASSLTAPTIISRSTFPAKTSRKDLRKRTGTSRSSARHCSWMPTLSPLACRCTRGMNQKSPI